MRTYVEFIIVHLRLALRDRTVIFFNYLFPLIFFFVFAQMLRAQQGGAIIQVVTMVLVIGVLGNGLFGAGMRAVQDREQNILRRFKVAPISPLPILVASLVNGWILYIPAVVLTVGLARLLYGMAIPENWPSLLALLSLGLIAFRAMGLIIASVANSTQESNIVIQLFYTPMLFLSGATFPIGMLPNWAQIAAQFLPATYLITGLQAILFQGEGLTRLWSPVAALLLTTVLAIFVSLQLFRWEKDEKVRGTAKLWLAAVLMPFLVLGLYQAYSRDHIVKAKVLYRELRRSRTLLIRGGRLFVEGRAIDSGALLVRSGKIAEIYPGAAPDPDNLRAEAVEASGKTVLPGFIDAWVDLRQPGGFLDGAHRLAPGKLITHNLAAHLYCGVTAVGLAPGSPPVTNHEDQLGAQPVSPSARIASASDVRGIARALGAGAAAIETSGLREPIPDEVLADMARRKVAYLPALAAVEAGAALAAHNPELLSRSLVQQVAPAGLIRTTQEAVRRGALAGAGADLDLAKDNLRRAFQAGVPLVAGSGAGHPLVLHGPALHREFQLWVQAGVSPAAALEAAGSRAAALLSISTRTGGLRKGHDADLVLVDGNPLQDIAATERISLVIFQGERIDRTGLFEEK